MDTYIGIKDVRWNPLQKHELLLFNKVAVPFVDEALSHLHGTAPGADLEWLLPSSACRAGLRAGGGIASRLCVSAGKQRHQSSPSLSLSSSAGFGGMYGVSRSPTHLQPKGRRNNTTLVARPRSTVAETSRGR
jgi:hypothetical protein